MLFLDVSLELLSRFAQVYTCNSHLSVDAMPNFHAAHFLHVYLHLHKAVGPAMRYALSVLLELLCTGVPRIQFHAVHMACLQLPSHSFQCSNL